MGTNCSGRFGSGSSADAACTQLTAAGCWLSLPQKFPALS